MEKHIATIEKSQIEEIRVDLSEYQSLDLIDIRIYANYEPGNTERRPTKKGVSIRVGRLPEIIAALQEAEREAVEAGLLYPSATDEAD